MQRLLTLCCLTLAMSAGVAYAQDDEPESERKRFADWDETLENWRDQKGFMTLWRPGEKSKEKGERLLAAIKEDHLEKPFFFATSVSGGSDYAGWQWEDKLVRLERRDKQLLLIEINTQQRAEKGKPIAEVVQRTYQDRLLATFPIVSISEDDQLLFDLGELLSNNYGTFFGGMFSLRSSLARFVKTKAFPKNLEIGVQMPLYGDGTFMTLHYSISELPALEEYVPRQADERVGYFLTAIRDYSKGDPQDGRMVRLINRWKLEKADPELALSPPKEPIVFYIERTVPIAYREAVAEGILAWNKAFEQVGIKGAMVVRQQTDTQFQDLDPEDVRYNFFRWITSETPFAMGPSRVDPRNGRILDADIIFDDSMLRGYQFDYDVLLREAPEKQLSRASAELLRARPQLHPFAHLRQPGTPDPRLEGIKQALREVLKPETAQAVQTSSQLEQMVKSRGSACQVGNYMPHQVGLFRLAMASALEGQPGLTPYMEQIVRETVMHEVGHTLGLRHNFKASSMLTLAEMNAENRPEAISASVMDYHPVNLAGPDLKQGNFLMTSIGPYDMVAIEFGYALGEEGSEELKAIPRKIAAQGLPYATDEDVGSPDPLIARWDMGSDPIAYADARTKLVASLWKDLDKRVVGDDQAYSRLRRAVDTLLFEVQMSSLSVARQVGGLSFFRDHKGDPKAREPISVVPAEKQRAALTWMCEQILSGKALEVPSELEQKLAAGRWVHWGTRDGGASLDYSLMDRVVGIQSWAVFALTADDVLARVWENEQRALQNKSEGKVLTVVEVFEALEREIFRDLERPLGASTAADPYLARTRQALQDAYVRRLIALSLGNGVSPPVANKIATQRLMQLESNFSAVLAGAGERLDPYTRAHLEVLRARSQKVRSPDYVHLASGGDALCALSSPSTEDGAAWFFLALVLLGLGGVRLAAGRGQAWRQAA